MQRPERISQAPNPTVTAPTDTVIEGLIQINKAPAVELQLFGLMLKNRAYWFEAMDEGVAALITHPGVKALLEKAAELIGQGPEKFDKLTGLLTSFVDRSELLISAGETPVSKSVEIDEFEKQKIERGLFRDYLRKVKSLALEARAKRIQQQLKSAPTPELMEELMMIQRERMAMGKDSREREPGSETSH
jgi:hypothetical protein